jgi:hypothetical protein
MAHSWVVDGQDSLQICMVAANILHKQLQKANIKNPVCHKMLSRTLDLKGTLKFHKRQEI